MSKKFGKWKKLQDEEVMDHRRLGDIRPLNPQQAISKDRNVSQGNECRAEREDK